MRSSQQFRVLYRHFLSRTLDLNSIFPGTDATTLLARFIALLASLSLIIAARGSLWFMGNPSSRDAIIAFGSHEEFLIATSMAIAGIATLLAWDAGLPGLSDCLILGVLPVPPRTIFMARSAGILTFVGASSLAINCITGLAYPLIYNPAASGILAIAGTFCAHWITIGAATAFVFCVLIALQSVILLVFGFRRFSRLTGIAQVFVFGVILSAYTLKPGLPEFLSGGGAPGASYSLLLPSTWFYGLFRVIAPGGHSQAVAQLANTALIALALAFVAAVVGTGLSYVSAIPKIVESSDRAGGPAFGRIGLRICRAVFPSGLDRALILFTVRTAVRSKQHQFVLTFFGGAALGIGLIYSRDLIYGYSSIFDDFGLDAAASTHWNQTNIPFLVSTLIAICLAVIGARGAFVLPMTLPANWIFRITASEPPAKYFSAVRKALLVLACAPVWISSALLLFTIWPFAPAAEHICLLLAAGIFLSQLALYRFRKIPFTCSYAASGASLNFRLGAFAMMFLLITDRGVQLEYWAMQDVERFSIMLVVLVAAILIVHRKSTAWDDADENRLQFEETDRLSLSALDLRQDGVWSTDNALADSIDLNRAKTLRDSLVHKRDPGPLVSIGAALSATDDVREHVIPAERTSMSTTIEQILQDFSRGLRILTKSPGYSLAVILLITIGIGWNTAIYSAIHSVLTRPAPGIHGSGLVSLGVAANRGEDDPAGGADSFPDYLDYQRESHSLSAIAAFVGDHSAVTTQDGTYELRTQLVTSNYFGTLGVSVIRGRVFTEDDARAGSGLVAIITYGVWQRYFRSSDAVINQTITMNGQTATIIGVAAEGFQGTTLAPNLQVCLPLSIYSQRKGLHFSERAERSVQMIGRLANGISLSQAQAEFDSLSSRIKAAHPELKEYGKVELIPYSATAFGALQTGRARLLMVILTLVALLTLLIVCANIANLMLARSVARQRELALRQCLGASWFRIMRVQLLEGLTLSLAGLTVAWVFAVAACKFVVTLIPPSESGSPIALDLTPDWQVGLYATGLALAAAVIFTLAPTFAMRRQAMMPMIRAGEQSIIQGRSILANVLVVAQLAICLVLMVDAGLALRSISLIETTDLEFQKDHLILAQLNTTSAATNGEQNLAILEQLRGHLKNVPGVVSASYGFQSPPRASTGIALQTADSSPGLTADANFVGPDYLKTLGVRILAGRDFEAGDMVRGITPAIVNQKLAAIVGARRPVLGSLLTVEGESRPANIVGVVPDGAFSGLDRNGVTSLRKENRGNFVFLPEKESHGTPGPTTFHIRYTGSLQTATLGVRSAIHDTDSRVLIVSLSTMESAWAGLSAPAYFISRLLGLFAVGALLMSSVGLYAVASFYSAKRRREFGVRMALGATESGILNLVLKEGLILSTVGVAAGGVISAALSRVISGVLFAIPSYDPVTYLAVIATLTAVSLVACYLPACRAARTDPSNALRQD